MNPSFQGQMTRSTLDHHDTKEEPSCFNEISSSKSKLGGRAMNPLHEGNPPFMHAICNAK